MQARLNSVEVAAGQPLGIDPGAASLRPIGSISLRWGLEQVLLACLLRGPMFVSFSGGRDSSALLATAAFVARREGLPPPIPVTLTVGGSSRADEEEWQRLVLAHVGIDDWYRVPVSCELDLLGPTAQSALSRHGLLWPFNSHLHEPLFSLAGGGTLVTGFGGDEVFDQSGASRLRRALAGQVRFCGRDALLLGLSLSPQPVWRYAGGRRRTPELEWLTAYGQRRVTSAWTRLDLPDHWGWGRALLHSWRSRYRVITEGSLKLLVLTMLSLCQIPSSPNFASRPRPRPRLGQGEKVASVASMAAMSRYFGD
jgi:hypothetical protein